MRPGVITIVFGATLMGLVLGGQEPGSRPGYTGVTPDRPIKCGWGAHPELLWARIAAPLARPVCQVMYISQSGAFAVHYDTTGRHSPDTTSTQVDGTPDWVVEVAAALDSARSLLLALGFDPAPADDDSVYDVYLQEYNGYTYGLTEPDGADVHGRTISYMRMDNDFAEDEYYYTHGIDAARVTAAHEYFHAVQMGYKPAHYDVFFYELSSTWFEDVVFPEVNDWVFWYPDFGNNPTQPITTPPLQGGGYSIAIFGHYLTHITGTYQPDIMLQTWESFKSSGAVAAIEQSVTSYGSNLTTAWTDFVARLFLNGVDTTYYFHPDQDWLTLPNAGVPQLLSGSQSQVFEGLKLGTAGIRALDLAGPTNLYLQIEVAPPVYAARLVLNSDRLALDTLTQNPWYVTGLTSLSRPILVVGGEAGNVEIMATAIDALVPLDYALDFLAPNPVYPHGRLAHTSLTLGYRIAEALPQADHRIVIYNILGQELYRQQITRSVGEGSHKLHMSTQPFITWPSGVYILSLTVDQRHTFARTFTLLR